MSFSAISSAENTGSERTRLEKLTEAYNRLGSMTEIHIKSGFEGIPPITHILQESIKVIQKLEEQRNALASSIHAEYERELQKIREELARCKDILKLKEKEFFLLRGDSTEKSFPKKRKIDINNGEHYVPEVIEDEQTDRTPPVAKPRASKSKKKKTAKDVRKSPRLGQFILHCLLFI
ncbi:Oidioi.mRNA.OKI2018_I69.chr1.g3439.t1.cds [Oikopleura dioica]|uniref:Oidioi.mRNA.OKI2018_I69.chr1.g3439.t1.cds n=1 Tax=Oikopleura dioica TaxID=34765 RepID=A0ABN7SY21_OIKDI|nr:Oidioi.mRNA.OKI2018_I69.chr1.g3439.t1.cds [Oikopleura dioica]